MFTTKWPHTYDVRWKQNTVPRLLHYTYSVLWTSVAQWSVVSVFFIGKRDGVDDGGADAGADFRDWR